MLKQMFQGRIGVADYWKAIVVFVGIAIAASIVLGFAFAALMVALFSSSGGSSIVGIGIAVVIGAIAYLIALVVGTGMLVRRLHDLNVSGWYVLVLWAAGAIVKLFGQAAPGSTTLPAWAVILSGLSALAWLVIAFWPGKAEPNTYGMSQMYRSWWAGLIGSKA